MRFLVMRDCDGSHIRCRPSPQQVRNTKAKSKIADASVLRDRDFVQDSAAAENKFKSSVAGSLHPEGDAGLKHRRAGSGGCDIATDGSFFLTLAADYHGDKPQRTQIKPRCIPGLCLAKIMVPAGAIESPARQRGARSVVFVEDHQSSTNHV
jgi:hypothetical protein